MLKESTQQQGSRKGIKQREQSKMTASWVEIKPEWAYWIDTESFNFRRAKKRAPVGSIIVIKKKEKLDRERTYVDSSFGMVVEKGIAELTKREASAILARQVLEYMRRTKRWPPFTSVKRTLKSTSVEVCYEPTEYDSFVLLMTREMIGSDPSDFFGRLGKHVAPQEPLWRVEPARSGNSRCRTCKDVILEGRFRIGEPYFYEGSFAFKWHHPRCVATRIDVNELENLDGYNSLKTGEKQRLKHLLQQ